MTPGGSARSTIAGEQLWLRSPWPLLLTICGAAALWTFIAGDPFESLEMRWFGQILRWRYEQGVAPPVDSSIVHVDITQVLGSKSLFHPYLDAFNASVSMEGSSVPFAMLETPRVQAVDGAKGTINQIVKLPNVDAFTNFTVAILLSLSMPR